MFAMPAAPVDVGDETETWHGADRDYTYSEVRMIGCAEREFSLTGRDFCLAPRPNRQDSPSTKSRPLCRWPEALHHRTSVHPQRR